MDLYEMRNIFNKEGIIMCFNGAFSESIIEETAKAMRIHLTSENISQVSVLDAFAIYIELAQNVRNYTILRKIAPPESASSILAIALKEGVYSVSSGNMVLFEDKEMLMSRIQEVNNMTPEEVKRQYREVLRRDTDPGSLGAGLGFLEIAKRTANKMLATFEPINDTFGFFTLTAFI